MTSQNPQLLEVDVSNVRILDARDGSPSNVSPLPLTDRVQSAIKKQEVPQSYNVTDRNEIDNNDVISIRQNATIDARNLKIDENDVIDQKFESENANVARSIDTQQTYPQTFPRNNNQITRGVTLQTDGTKINTLDRVIRQDSELIQIQSFSNVIDVSNKSIENSEKSQSQIQKLNNKKLNLDQEYKNLQTSNIDISDKLNNIDKEFQINEQILEQQQTEKLQKIKEIQKQTTQDIEDLKVAKEQAWAQRNIIQRQSSNVSSSEIGQIKIDAEITEKQDQLAKIEQYLDLEQKKGQEFRNQEVELLNVKKEEQIKVLSSQKEQQLQIIENIRQEFVKINDKINRLEAKQQDNDQDKEKIEFIKEEKEDPLAQTRDEDEIAQHRQVFQEARKQKKIKKCREDFQKIKKEKEIAKHREAFQSAQLK